MMYPLMHWLFGWDYVHWRNTASQGVARVRLDGMGRVWYWRSKAIRAADQITDPHDVLWLTCGPDKYGFYGHNPSNEFKTHKTERNIQENVYQNIGNEQTGLASEPPLKKTRVREHWSDYFPGQSHSEY